jgi:protein involved in polysaccharide export with SLBB domain
MLLAAPMESGESEKPLLDLPDLPADDLLVRPNEEGVGAGERGVTIQPDTVLWVSVEEDPSLNGKYLVNEYSAIDFGYVGLVLLNDMNVDSAAMKLRGILESRYLKKATVGVKLAKASYDRVGVGGAVLNPGMLKIGPGSTISLNDALRRAGGLRLEATEARVKVIKNGLLSPFGPIAEGTIYPLVDEEGKPTIPRIDLSNSDLVYVFTRQTSTASVGEKRILLLGEVSRPGFVQFNGNEPCTLMHLLFKIGGLTKFAKTDGIRIIRRDKNGRETEIQADAKNLLREGNPDDDIMLENDDRIIVPTRGIKFF